MIRFGKGSTAGTRASHGPFTLEGDGTVRIDFSKLDAPNRLYDADSTWVRRGGGFVGLVFGKLNLDNERELLTRLEIKMAPESFIRHFWENSSEFLKDLQTQLAKWPKDPLLVPVDGRGLKADRSHSEWANFSVIARSGGHGTIDFFYLPPLGIAQFMKGLGVRQLVAVPVVRILITIHQLSYLFEQSRGIIDEVRRYLPEEVLNG